MDSWHHMRWLSRASEPIALPPDQTEAISGRGFHLHSGPDRFDFPGAEGIHGDKARVLCAPTGMRCLFGTAKHMPAGTALATVAFTAVVDFHGDASCRNWPA